MSGKIGIAVMLLSAVAWLAMENTSEAGRHHRRGRCGGGGCSTGCSTGGCNTGCAPAAECGSGCAEAAPEAPAAPADGEAAPAPPAHGAAAQPAQAPQAPAVTATTSEHTVASYNYGSRRARRGLFRR